VPATAFGSPAVLKTALIWNLITSPVVAAAAFSAVGLVSDVVLTISIDFWK